MEGLNDDQKVEALLAQLGERYTAARKMRERSTQFGLWISGMGIALAWALLREASLSRADKLAITILALGLVGGTVYFLGALSRGFGKNREAMINVERALQMHEEGAYVSDEPLLPDEYGKATRRWSSHFLTLFAWLLLVAISLAILVWSRPDCPTQQRHESKIQQAEEGRNDG